MYEEENVGLAGGASDVKIALIILRDPESTPLSVLGLTLDATIMQAFVSIFSSHFHSVLRTASMPSTSNWSLEVSLILTGASSST